MVITSIEQPGSNPEGGRPKTQVLWTDPPICLDFTNTLYYRSDSSKEKDSLNSYADLLAWCIQAGTLSDAESQQLLREAESRLRDAAQALRRARRLRETIYRIFFAIAQGIPPNETDLVDLNAALARTVSKSRIVATNDVFTWTSQVDCDALDRVIWPVIWSATDLLTSGGIRLVKHCAASDCRSLFLDISRNKKRRWCRMSSCGNRAKARRHYHRLKGAAN